jgi:hypothetical protein
VSIDLQIHPATAQQLGPAAVAVAKLAASIRLWQRLAICLACAGVVRTSTAANSSPPSRYRRSFALKAITSASAINW